MEKMIIKMRKMTMNEEIYLINQSTQNERLINLEMCGITYPDKSYEINRPKSHTACIEYVVEGCGTVSLGDNTFYPQEGDTYFLHQGMDQHYYSDKEKPWKKYFINIYGDLAKKLIDSYALKGECYFPGLDIGDEMKKIIDVAGEEGVDHTGRIVGLLNEILFKMHQCVKIKSSHSDVAIEMRNFLDLQITQKFSIKDLANKVSKSPSHTIRIFREEFGITPYAYVLNKKIEYAKQLLINTNLPIKQIADDLKFADEYYFSNIFKEKTQITPGKFRKTK